MRIVITGGTGLIGGAVAREMGSAGHEVVVLTRNLSKTKPLPPNTRAAQWDGRTAGDWARLLDGDTVIVHLAGDAIAEG
ncbi:MAG TPA: NAD-dependent epimerase/dehydratase family protein, partial [Thermoanaerobaculia bacterium]